MDDQKPKKDDELGLDRSESDEWDLRDIQGAIEDD